MTRKCPGCGGLHVRRSSIRVSEVTWRQLFLSPYRCRDCRERFWVLSKKAYYFAGTVGLAVVTGVIAWNVFGMPDDRRAKPERAAQVIGRFADTAKLAEKNDPLAEYNLAQMYAQGYGVPKNEKEARKWLERAANHGNTDAQYEFGIALRDGRGVVQDFRRAVRWLQRAADSGNAAAQFELGLMYRAGTGIPIDSVKAYTWLNLAAARGVEDAAPPRDAVLRTLSPAEIVEAQAEARRLSETWAKPTTAIE